MSATARSSGRRPKTVSSGQRTPGGISKIFITDNGGANDVDLDHLQYGGTIAATGVPEPVSLLVWSALGLFGMCAARRRR
jgi:hypothetical protein